MIEHKMHIHRQHRTIPAPPAGARSACPFCHSPSFKAPGPCAKCGTTGFSTGEPPAYRGLRRRVAEAEILKSEEFNPEHEIDLDDNEAEAEQCFYDV